MSHQVESLMYIQDEGTPWHGLGTPVEKAQTSEEAIISAGLDWEVQMRRIEAVQDMDDGTESIRSTTDEFCAMTRSTDGKILGVGSPKYTPVQNREAFSFFDSIVGEKLAIFHTAGSLMGGKRIWLLAKLPGHIIVPGTDDITEKFLLFANGHDGSLGVRGCFSPVRVVCQNTLNMALKGAGKDGFSIRHTRSVMAKVDEAKKCLGLANQFYADFQVKVLNLAATQFTEGQMKKVVENLFPVDADGDLSTRAHNNRETILDLFENGKGQSKVRGTAWAAYNAITEYSDHHAGTRVTKNNTEGEAKLLSNWFGSGKSLKQKGLDLVEAAVAVAA